MALASAAAIAQIIAAAASVYSMATAEAPKNNLTTTGTAGGGGQPKAESVFGGGSEWMQKRLGTGSDIQPVQAPVDPAVAAATAAMASGQQMPPLVSTQQTDIFKLPTGWEGKVPDPTAKKPASLGDFLSALGGTADALGAVAPLLGLGPGPQRSMQIAPPAGGQAGPPIFQLPQRNTLAQILASLPRTM